MSDSNPGPATLDWLGCATFRLTLGSLVVFLDAYVDRVSTAPPTGLTLAQIDRADWIVVGHAHFDHLWGAERIARQTGATVVGSHESIRVLREQGVPTEQLLPVAGGERIRLSDSVTVSVFPSLHSCIWSQAGFAQPDVVVLGDLDVVYQDRLARLNQPRAGRGNLSDEVLAHLQAGMRASSRSDGGALVYRFETPEGALLFQDTAGHWTGVLSTLTSDVAILAGAGRGNVDGEPTQGSLAQFLAREVQLAPPRRLVLGHHDDWLPGVSIPTNTAPIHAALTAAAPDLELVEMGYLAAYPIFANLPPRRSGYP